MNFVDQEKVGFKLGPRATRDGQEVSELFVATSPKTLSNVGHD